MLDFPASPTTGQVFGTWKWDGTKWMPNTNLSSPFVQSFNTRTGAVMLAQSDVTAVGAIRDVGRNLLHNPLMAVAQRGVGPFTNMNVYTLDRWIVSGATDTISIVQNALTDAARTQIGDESAIYALQNTFTGTSAGSNYLNQYIEGVRRLGGKTVTISLWAIAGTNGLKLSVNTFQTFGTGGSPSGATVGTPNVFTLTTTWARYSYTITLPSAAGKTFGSNGNDCTILRFYYSAGPSSGAEITNSGSIGQQSGVIALWGVQLEIGSVATPLDYGGSYADQLRACQRYYQAGTLSFGGYGTAATTVNAYYPLGVAMRAAPALAIVTPSYTNASGMTADQSAFGGFRYFVTVTATGMAYASGGWTASADL